MTKQSVITAFEGQAKLAYGSEMPTKLEIVCVDAAGKRHLFTLNDTALRQLAKVLRSIEVEVPGALKGH